MSTGNIQSNELGLKVRVGASVQRQTPKTDFGSVLGRGVAKATDAVLSVGQLAAPYIPGGQVVSAAISGLQAARSGLGNSVGSNSTPLGSGGGLQVGGNIGSNGTVTGQGGVQAGGDVFGSIEQNAAGGSESSQLCLATKKMQEMNQSFNLQYLQLQQKMQSDNRQFTLMSNIMKTKHDTAKNAINNVR